jgi:hypothetical protein
MSSYSISGTLVDARLTGSVARVVTRSAPGVALPEVTAKTTAARALAAMRAAIAAAPVSAWLPAYATSAVGGGVATGTIPCTSVSHPAAYSGPGLLTVGTFDMAASSLGTGTPVAIVGDGDTVYATASSLYIASGIRRAANPDAATPVPAPTSVYRFDTSGPGQPRYTGSATVPGYLVNQDAMSEWNGYLRVATTTGLPAAYGGFTARPGPGPGSPLPHSVSAVYELSLAGPAMRVAGQVTGLGPGMWIASVLFTGPAGYLATSGKADTLYALDLSQPAHPRQAGRLALTGYPEHLYPVSATRLIGVGRATGTAGRDLGLQVSAFSVASLAAPAQLARDTLPGSSAEAELDPRGFLYWPSGGLVVLPGSAGNGTGTLVLRLSGGQLARASLVRQPVAPYTNINRSLVTGGDTLWTASWAGLLAVSPATLQREAWIPLSR